jgi:hypothetical protein
MIYSRTVKLSGTSSKRALPCHMEKLSLTRPRISGGLPGQRSTREETSQERVSCTEKFSSGGPGRALSMKAGEKGMCAV